MTRTETTTLRPVTPLGLAVEALENGESQRALALLRGLDQYLSDCTSPPSDALVALARASDHHPWDPDDTLEAEMLSGHVEGALLALLVKLTGAQRILDVGTFTGYSALAMAEAAGADGRVVTCELDDGVADMARAAFDASPVGDRLRIEVGPALATLDRLADAEERFDLAFLDADKPGYLPVFELLLDRSLVREGGLIVADNTLLQGQPYAVTEANATEANATEPNATEANATEPNATEPNGVVADANGRAIAEFNAAVAADDRVEQVLLPVRDGVTLARVHTR